MIVEANSRRHACLWLFSFWSTSPVKGEYNARLTRRFSHADELTFKREPAVTSPEPSRRQPAAAERTPGKAAASVSQLALAARKSTPTRTLKVTELTSTVRELLVVTCVAAGHRPARQSATILCPVSSPQSERNASGTRST